jgi:hypothetical protein
MYTELILGRLKYVPAVPLVNESDSLKVEITVRVEKVGTICLSNPSRTDQSRRQTLHSEVRKPV